MLGNHEDGIGSVLSSLFIYRPLGSKGHERWSNGVLRGFKMCIWFMTNINDLNQNK
jgi:hypothetical protein